MLEHNADDDVGARVLLDAAELAVGACGARARGGGRLHAAKSMAAYRAGGLDAATGEPWVAGQRAGLASAHHSSSQFDASPAATQARLISAVPDLS